MKFNQKIFTTIGIVLAAIAFFGIVGGGSWYFTQTAKSKPASAGRQQLVQPKSIDQTQNPSANFVSIQSQEPVASSTQASRESMETQQASAIDTSSWQLYVDAQVGFEFKYPANLARNGAIIVFSPTRQITIKTHSGATTENCGIFSSDDTATDSSVVINGINFRKRIGGIYNEPGVITSQFSLDDYNIIDYSTTYNATCINIIFSIDRRRDPDNARMNISGYDATNEPEVKIFDQMLSTFKFTAPQLSQAQIVATTWKTYQNNLFSIEYPVDYHVTYEEPNLPEVHFGSTAIAPDSEADSHEIVVTRGGIFNYSADAAPVYNYLSDSDEDNKLLFSKKVDLNGTNFEKQYWKLSGGYVGYISTAIVYLGCSKQNDCFSITRPIDVKDTGNRFDSLDAQGQRKAIADAMDNSQDADAIIFGQMVSTFKLNENSIPIALANPQSDTDCASYFAVPDVPGEWGLSDNKSGADYANCRLNVGPGFNNWRFVISVGNEPYSYGAVYIFDGNGKFVQKIIVGGDQSFAGFINDASASQINFADDINFDGYRDLQVPINNGPVDVEIVTADYWIFDPVSKQFKKDTVLTDVANAVFDKNNKTITSRVGVTNACFNDPGCDTSGHTTIYKFNSARGIYQKIYDGPGDKP